MLAKQAVPKPLSMLTTATFEAQRECRSFPVNSVTKDTIFARLFGTWNPNVGLTVRSYAS